MTDQPVADEADPRIRRLADWDHGRLAEVAEEYGTPLYVLDPARVRENYARFAAAFPDAHVMYAAKAHTGRAVLSALLAEGADVNARDKSASTSLHMAALEAPANVVELLDGPTTAFDVMEGLFGDLPATEQFPGMSEAVGHLDVLEERGRATHSERGGVRVYEEVEA